MAMVALALGVACGFEFVNGFHDTANAVATVIYTRSLKPMIAVIWSGIWNFLGVNLGGVAVAFAIVHMLPVDLLVHVGSHRGMAMVFALLVGAILWNLGTWLKGLPASSSHTLVGSILGVGMANALLSGQPVGASVNWAKAGEVGLSLLISPILGFGLSAALLLLAKRFLREPHLYEPPVGDKPPPHWIRGLLVFTCTGVSFAHGSNDGQKGVGLIMLILIGILPARFALDTNQSPARAQQTEAAIGQAEQALQRCASESSPATEQAGLRYFLKEMEQLRTALAEKGGLSQVPAQERWQLRTDILELDAELATLASGQSQQVGEAERQRLAARRQRKPALPRFTGFTGEEKEALLKCRSDLRGMTDYAPTWVLLLVATSLGMGTMVGWKRIVVTVGEKIGKTHLTYAQGACAELVAMSTIGLADQLGMPVSTTHVLSSGVAGTMAANRSGLQFDTVRSIALAWILTLPAAMVLSGGLFMLFRVLVP
jgi:phosphate/sulfate permease